MNPKTLQTIFRFDRRWANDDYDEIENKGVYIFLREITSPLSHPYDTSTVQYAAFLYSLKSVAIEFLLPEDETGRASLEGFSDQVQGRFRDLTTEQIIELWQNNFWSQLKFNSEKEEYFGTLGRTISDTMLEDVLSISVARISELELEKIRLYLKHAVPKSEWYQFYGANLTDSESLEEIDNRIARIL